LYGSPLYYWTFYLLNDDIREQGWPLTRLELEAYTKKSFPNTVLVTREPIATKFKVGQVVTGTSSGASGTIIRRNLNLGQIVIKGDISFSANGELLQSTNSSGVLETVTTISRIKEYLSASHYINDSGRIVDLGVDSATGGLLAAGAQQTEKTFEDVYFANNESLRQIKVIKPSVLGSVISSYKKAIRE